MLALNFPVRVILGKVTPEVLVHRMMSIAQGAWPVVHFILVVLKIVDMLLAELAPFVVLSIVS